MLTKMVALATSAMSTRGLQINRLIASTGHLHHDSLLLQKGRHMLRNRHYDTFFPADHQCPQRRDRLPHDPDQA